MKDFMLDKNGELVIQNGKIPLVSDKELIVQKVRQVLRTHLGEWKYDIEEGIDRYALFTKKPNYDLIEDTVKSGLLQVDDTFRITSFACTEEKDRHLSINLGATNSEDEEISVEL